MAGYPGWPEARVSAAAGDHGGQLIVTRGQRGARQPGGGGGFSQQEPRRREVGADLADVADGGRRAVPRFADLSLGQGGLGARVQAGEMRHRLGPAGDVLGCGRDVTAAQRDHAENAVRRRGISVRP